MEAEVQSLIEHFHLKPLPAEGTLFASTWRSQQEFTDGSPLGTAMLGLYCEEPPSYSVFHRPQVDEVWHFYGGDPLRLVLLHADGSHSAVIMGSRPLEGHQIQFVVKAGTWQAGHLLSVGKYALFGCTLAPGFTGRMYEGAERSALLHSHPACRADILALTHEAGKTRMPKGFAK